MNIQEKVSEYKSLSYKLIDCQKALEEAIENHSVNQDEIYNRILELRKAVDECAKEIMAMRGK